MRLREDQILRYSRQILLREVGGAGQLTLLGHPAELLGSGLALQVAGAHLAAAGTPLRLPAAEGQGYWFGGEASERAILLHPDVRADAKPVGAIATARAALSGALGHRVLLGGHRGGAAVVWAHASGCEACWEGLSLVLDPSIPEELEVAAGASAAWAFQRLVLGLERGVGAVGLLAEAPAYRCARHA